jgi:hypothetical protein
MRGGTNVQAREVPAMGELSSPLAEIFSLIRNGPAHRFPFRISRAVNEHRRVIVKALLAVTTPFFHDVAVNVRFLIALPILILAKSSIDQRWD